MSSIQEMDQANGKQVSREKTIIKRRHFKVGMRESERQLYLLYI